MSRFQLSPSVSVTERDLTTIVPAVATTNAGFAGLFEWGPVNKVVTVSNVQELVARFGLPRDGNFTHWFTAANYLGYGNNLKVVRGGDLGQLRNAGPTGNQTDTTSMNPSNVAYLIEDEDAAPSKTNFTSVFYARYPGSLGNSLRVEYCGSSYGAGYGVSTGGTGFDSWSLKNNFTAVPTTTTYADRVFGGSAGSNVLDAFHLAVIDRDGKITGVTGTVLETFENLSIIPGAVGSDGTSIYYKTRINNASKYLVAVGGNNINNISHGFAVAASNLPFIQTGTTVYKTGGVFAANLGGGGGTGDNEWNTGSLYLTSSGTSGGYAAFSDPDTSDISLLLGGPAHGSTAALITDMAKARKDCVAFVSPAVIDPTVAGDTKIAICTTTRNAVGNNNYAFIDSGYKYMYDAYNDTYRYVPLNGDIAGLCARTDSTNDPWYSPAGFNRGQVRGVVKLAFNPTATQRDTIYANGINPVVTFPGEGTCLFGDKTAQTKSSAFDRINVRRLFIVLEKAIATAAQYSLFEFNDAFTRAQFKSLVEPFLRDVQARRGITDFKVVCSESNNTAAVIDANRFVADIYIKPNRSINFIQLNFIATRTGVSFDEVGA
jgi:hypothetical protein